jgi:hypothetical protein
MLIRFYNNLFRKFGWMALEPTALTFLPLLQLLRTLFASGRRMPLDHPELSPEAAAAGGAALAPRAPGVDFIKKPFRP